MNDETPTPVDLDYLSDRAKAYVLGLEATNRRLREHLDELRAKLAGELKPDERYLKAAYRDGWRACAAKIREDALTLRRDLDAVVSGAARAYCATPKYDEEHR